MHQGDAYLAPGHPLLEAVSTRYSQGQGRMNRNLGQAREYLDAVPDGWLKFEGEWVRIIFDEDLNAWRLP